MANYLVTGGAGFIGSHLVDALLADGHNVRILDNLSTGNLQQVPQDAEFIEGDIRDASVVRKAMRRVDGCFHLAAVASVEQSVQNWAGTHAVNITGTINVFDAARSVNEKPAPVVYASSAAVYGDNASIPLTETARLRPLSAYGADKLSCELHARVAGIVHQLPTLGFRFFNVYGPRQDPSSPYSGVISIFCNRIASGTEITVFGDGSQVRDFVYVGDVVAHLKRGMLSPSTQAEVLNICSGRPTSIRQLATTLFSIAGRRIPIRNAAPRKGDIQASIGDASRCQKRLGIKADKPLNEGLKATYAFIASSSELAEAS